MHKVQPINLFQDSEKTDEQSTTRLAQSSEVGQIIAADKGMVIGHV
jgi:hypothetical protein